MFLSFYSKPITSSLFIVKSIFLLVTTTQAATKNANCLFVKVLRNMKTITFHLHSYFHFKLASQALHHEHILMKVSFRQTVPAMWNNKVHARSRCDCVRVYENEEISHLWLRSSIYPEASKKEQQGAIFRSMA